MNKRDDEQRTCAQRSDVPVAKCYACRQHLCSYHWKQKTCPKAFDRSRQEHFVGAGG